MASLYSVTYFPIGEADVSKSNTQDDTISISNRPEMPNLETIMEALIQRGAQRNNRLLSISMAQAKLILSRGAAAASVHPFVPHRLRHGGASMEAMLNTPPEEIQRRGRWLAAKSVQRYRKPGRYIAQMEKLTESRCKEARLVAPTIATKIAKMLTARP